MIKKVTIRDVASYDSKGVVFDDLQRVNFIFGGNGAGKTTLSRLLAALPDGGVGFTIKGSDNNQYQNCDVEWEDDDEADVLVYNQDFKKRNLTEDMPGVFTIGEDWTGRYRRRKRLWRREWELKWEVSSKEELTERLQQEKEKLLEEKDLYSVEPSIDYMNELLEDHGYYGFRLRTSPGQPYFYQIQRADGTLASESLSEGEATIITFLYFHQLVESSGSNYGMKTRKVVVIDDPISSLDYDAIDLVSSLTNELIAKARSRKEEDQWMEQMIVLTHNATFHQSLSVRQPRKNTHYWKLYKKTDHSMVNAYQEENPVRSDYGTLWLRLKDAYNRNSSMEMPNLMRRIVETYFVDYGQYEKKKLFSGEYVTRMEDKRSMVSLAKWFDEGSHGVKDNLHAGNEEKMCEKYMNKLKKMFEVMGHGAHYEMMMRESL